jgi:NADH-quinone oxidoreductase subunit H
MFVIFFISALAETNRPPFDLPEAESELVAGYQPEYSGMMSAMFWAAEFAALLVYCAILANMYFGGWSGFFLSDQLGALWFLLKIVIFIFIFEWVRLSIPRLRIDQIMSFAWKFLFPLSLINLVITAVQVYIFNNVTTPGVITSQELWIMAAINIVLAISLIPLFGFLVKDRIVKPYAKTTTQDLILEKVG